MTYSSDNYGNEYNQGYGQGGAQGYGQGGSGHLPKFDTKRLVTNLAVLAVLAGIVAFAVIFLISALLNTAQGLSLPGAGESVILAAFSAIIGLVISLIYLPIYGTGNENLYRVAIMALTIVAVFVYVLLGGLLQGDWATLKTLAVFLCAAAIAMMAPQRIADSANY